MIPCDYPADVWEFGLIDPEFGIGVSEGHDVVVYHQQLLNFPWEDNTIY